jgi:hypothetical protein
VRGTIELAQYAHCVAVAAAGGDRDLDSVGLGLANRGKATLADVTVGVEQSSIHIYRDESGSWHSSSRIIGLIR